MSTGIEYLDAVEVVFDPLWGSDVVHEYRDYDFSPDKMIRREMKREEYTKKYAWAIPNEDALAAIAKFSPLVEIGAGTGYWAYELRKRGVTIDAYDLYPADGSHWTKEEEETAYGNGPHPNKNWYHRGHGAWTEVLQGDPNVMKGYSAEWNLFLCWPPYQDPMAAYALGYHRGNYIAYVGEDYGGCTGDRLFHKLLHKLYDCIEQVSLPQWSGIHDFLTIYERKSHANHSA